MYTPFSANINKNKNTKMNIKSKVLGTLKKYIFSSQ